MDKNKLNALIALLDDSDLEVVNAVNNNLLKGGLEIIPHLEKIWENTPDEGLQERIENVIHHIQFKTTLRNLRLWKKEGAEDVLRGTYYLARFQYPDLSFDKIHSAIEQIKNDIWLDLHNHLTDQEKIKILNYVIFDIHKFMRNSNNYYSPQNSFINQVLETRKGNPISLAIIYIAVAQKLNLPVFGVNLPKNFILGYKNEQSHQLSNEPEDILFYINPYNKGAILTRNEIDLFLKQQSIKPHKSYYTVCSNEDILIRLLNNLILSYEKLGLKDKIGYLKELLAVFI